MKQVNVKVDRRKSDYVDWPGILKDVTRRNSRSIINQLPEGDSDSEEVDKWPLTITKCLEYRYDSNGLGVVMGRTDADVWEHPRFIELQDSGKYWVVQAESCSWAPREAHETMREGASFSIGSAAEIWLSGKCMEVELQWEMEQLEE